ncbi:MAG: IclR family transcriptional regulator [Planctomycetes bacterium]|nr:IclR family transcriptional regulator [Planctomycetota bacterium]
MKEGPYESLRKAFEVLELLAARSPRGVTEIAAALGIQKSGASRLLKALSGWGYVVQDLRRGQYRSGPRVVALAEQYPQGDQLLRVAQPVMRGLAQSTRASVHLGLVVADRMLVAAKEASPETIQVASRVGGPIAPHASALGKILLASLGEKERAPFLKGPLARFTEHTVVQPGQVARMIQDVRRRGYALEAGEEHAGVGCIGVPIVGRAERWIAALSVSGPLAGTPFRLDARHRALALQAGSEISRRLALPVDA